MRRVKPAIISGLKADRIPTVGERNPWEKGTRSGLGGDPCSRNAPRHAQVPQESQAVVPRSRSHIRGDPTVLTPLNCSRGQEQQFQTRYLEHELKGA